MSKKDNKSISARTAAQLVLTKVHQILKESDSLKKYETEMKKEPSKAKKLPTQNLERDFKAFEVKPQKAKENDNQVEKQVSPSKNPKEAAEGNNKPDGMEPEYEFKDKVAAELAKEKASHMVKSQAGMHTVIYKSASFEKSESQKNDLNKAEKMEKGDWNKIHAKLKREGYSEKAADKIDGAIKAKMGKTESTEEMVHSDVDAVAHKAQYLHELIHHLSESKDCPAWMLEKIAQAKAHIQDVMDFVVGHEDMEKSEKMNKDMKDKALANEVKEHKIALPKAAKIAPHPKEMFSDLRQKKMGKAENPDEKEDAKLGEKVEHDVEEHFKQNKEAEAKEGHDLMVKPKDEKEMPKEDKSEKEMGSIPRLVGSAKLSKFMEHMHSKRKAKASKPDMDKK